MKLSDCLGDYDKLFQYTKIKSKDSPNIRMAFVALGKKVSTEGIILRLDRDRDEALAVDSDFARGYVAAIDSILDRLVLYEKVKLDEVEKYLLQALEDENKLATESPLHSC